jgi:hypothetical protein
MTRREDPGWGSPATAKRGNEDSMHVTNTTPQMQAFNAPIWLALEDYALQHAREDEMKISVFTGPYFADDDPEMYRVRIPLTFLEGDRVHPRQNRGAVRDGLRDEPGEDAPKRRNSCSAPSRLPSSASRRRCPSA